MGKLITSSLINLLLIYIILITLMRSVFTSKFSFVNHELQSVESFNNFLNTSSFINATVSLINPNQTTEASTNLSPPPTQQSIKSSPPQKLFKSQPPQAQVPRQVIKPISASKRSKSRLRNSNVNLRHSESVINVKSDKFGSLSAEDDCALIIDVDQNKLVEFINFERNDSSSRILASGELCITYKDIDDIVKEAIMDFGNFIPNEIKELSSNYPKPAHIAVVSAILEEVTKRLVRLFSLSQENVNFDLRTIDTTDTLISEICPTFLTPVRCEISKYRTLSGMCNNIKNPSWASARSSMVRYLTPSYEDAISKPRELSVTGDALPNPRYISQMIHQEESHFKDHGLSAMVASWGQVVVHDINFGSPTFDEKDNPINCCANQASGSLPHPACYQFFVPKEDSFYGMFNRSCINFVRLLPSLRPGCPLGPREPMNIVSGYIDASLVYGSSIHESNKVRAKVDGLLKSHDFKTGYKEMLPLQTTRPDFLCQRANRPKNMFCFESGDLRGNQQLPLVLLHTILMREHNRIARLIKKVIPELDDDTIYEETRRIVGASIQVITYREFLPIVIGDKAMSEYGLQLLDKGYSTSYDPKINAEPRVEFQSAAFRFGHSIVPDVIKRYNKNNEQLTAYRTSTLLRQPFELYKPGYADSFLLGLTNQETNRMDNSISTELTNHLFERPGTGFGSDLAAINILRGRELGVPPYNEFREYCGLKRALNFQDLAGFMSNLTINKLSMIYASVDDIDLFTGGTSEYPVPGAIVGPTFGCLIAEQFAALKKGDRFWFENKGWPSSFSPIQLEEIRKSSLARLLCDNGDDIEHIQIFPMLPADHDTNPRVPCSNLPSINVNHFFAEDIVTLRLDKKRKKKKILLSVDGKAFIHSIYCDDRECVGADALVMNGSSLEDDMNLSTINVQLDKIRLSDTITALTVSLVLMIFIFVTQTVIIAALTMFWARRKSRTEIKYFSRVVEKFAEDTDAESHSSMSRDSNHFL